ncbi:MAG: TonB-dependent receptor [SAR86 cluster bacterium]|nr:TonB-dependent receptor [SAR86 cluster bacterium]
MIKKNFILVFLLYASCTLSTSQYDEIITVATKIPTEDYKIPATIDVIDQKNIKETQPTDMLNLLSSSLAIDTSSNGGPGQVGSLFLRGSNSNHVLVKVNGVKINPSTAGGASIYNLDPNLISKIEIGSGPFSSIHGSEAIGGVINISTKNNTLLNKIKLGLGIGPDNHVKKYFQASKRFDETSLDFTILDNSTNGFPVLSNSSLDRGYENQSIIAGLSHRFKRLNMDISNWSSKGNVEYLVFGNPVSQDYENKASSADFELLLTKNHLIIINLHSSKDLISQNNLNFLGILDFTETLRNSYEVLIHKSNSKSLSYSAGYSKEHEDVDYSSYGSFFNKKLITNSFFGTIGWSFNKNYLMLSARQAEHETYGNQFSWNIGYLKPLNSSWSLNLNTGKAFRSPNSSELYGFGSNKNLSPEDSKSYEIGLRKRKEDYDLKIVYFNNKSNNLITFDFLDYVLKNIEESKNKGLELRYKWSKRYLNGSLIIRKQNPIDQNGDSLLRRSQKSASLNLNKDISSYMVNFSLSTFSRKKDFSKLKIPGYSRIDLSVTKKITNKLMIALKIQNLNNKEYFTATSSNGYYLNQDRSIWLKINYEF